MSNYYRDEYQPPDPDSQRTSSGGGWTALALAIFFAAFIWFAGVG